VDKNKLKKKGVRSPWREFEFWFMMVQYSIIPTLSVDHVLKNWNKIKEGLMENSRVRQLQVDKLANEN
jgi:hypothetical protein